VLSGEIVKKWFEQSRQLERNRSPQKKLNLNLIKLIFLNFLFYFHRIGNFFLIIQGISNRIFAFLLFEGAKFFAKRKHLMGTMSFFGNPFVIFQPKI
jgi:hypothetical protein